jgi:hypothetical protein
LFLASALLQQSGGRSSSSVLAVARQQYSDVLAGNPRSKTAVAGMVAVNINSRRLNEAHQWALKLIELDPSDKTSDYIVGLLDRLKAGAARNPAASAELFAEADRWIAKSLRNPPRL